MKITKATTRNELFNLVWSSPIKTVAKDFGLTDKGLAKRCKKHRIPTPPVGYWAKVQSGKKVVKAKLPKITDESLNVITFYVQEGRADSDEPIEIDSTILKKAESFVWPQKFNRHHPIIRNAKSGIINSTDKYGRVIFNRDIPEMGIRVTKTCLPRALYLLEGIVRLFDDCGWKYICSDKIYSSKHKTTAAFTDGNIDINIEIKELVNQSVVERDKHSYFSWNRYEYEPTGVLQLSILHIYESNFRKRWKDSIGRNIEEQLPSIVESVHRTFHHENQVRLKRERQEQEWQRQQEIRQKEQRNRELNLARKEHLLSSAHKHKEAESIRAFVHSIQSSGKSSPEKREWVQWALEIASEIDPLTNPDEFITKNIAILTTGSD